MKTLPFCRSFRGLFPLLAAAVLLAASASACCCRAKSCSPPPGSSESRWVVESVEGRELTREDGVGMPFFVLAPDSSRFAGYDGCNSVGGTLDPEAFARGELRLSNMMSTRRACLGSYDRMFNAALDRVVRFKVDGKRLTLFDAEGKVMMLCHTPEGDELQLFQPQ